MQIKDAHVSENLQIQTDLATMDFRAPILEDPSDAELAGGSGFISERRQKILDGEARKVDRRWAVATEAARRAILAGSEVATVAANYIDTPLDEQVPGTFLRAAQDANDTVSKATKHAGNILPEYLGLPSVPDELMPIDISSSAPHHSKAEAQAKLQHDLERYPVLYDGSVADMKQWASVHGITQREKQLVAKRHKYGRDVKLLGLLAELKNQSPQLREEDGVLKAELPSGVRLGITQGALESDVSLLHPDEWKSRRQIKDRVYEVTIGDKRYILKEKKTNRHTDTTHRQGQGHEEGLSSRDEFIVGRKMAEHGRKAQNGVELEWEEPIAYAEFPDGYQFALFHKIEGLTSRTGAMQDRLAQLIEAEPEAYEDDYERAKLAAKTLFAERTKEKRARLPGYMSPSDELDFDSYAQAKANAMVCLAEALVKESAFDEGFWNQDHDRMVDFGMQIVRSDDGTYSLKIYGFDYEYFKDNPFVVQNQRSEYEQRKDSGWLMKEAAMYKGGASIQQAAEYVLMSRYGWGVPPVDM